MPFFFANISFFSALNMKEVHHCAANWTRPNENENGFMVHVCTENTQFAFDFVFAAALQ